MNCHAHTVESKILRAARQLGCHGHVSHTLSTNSWI
jgi:hypothetical protein